MPKELSHFAFAEYICERLPENSPVRQAIARYPAAYYLGSVIHDCPFYSTKSPETLRRGAHLHARTPEDELAGLAALGAEYDQTHSPLALALVAGALTHRAADITFHPVVFSHCGHRGIEHHVFEVALDKYVLTGYAHRYAERQRGNGASRKTPCSFFRRHISRGRVRVLVRLLEPQRRYLCELLGRFYSAGSFDGVGVISPARAGRVLDKHAGLQRLLLLRPLTTVLQIAARVVPGLRNIASVCYPLWWHRGRRRRWGVTVPMLAQLPPSTERRRGAAFSPAVVGYVHPQSGKWVSTTLDEMIDKTVAAGEHELRGLDEAVGAGAVGDWLGTRERLSLVHGLDKNIPTDLSYYVS